MIDNHRQRLEDADNQTMEAFGATIDLLANMRSALTIAEDAIVECGRLRADRDYWKNKYVDELNHSIKTSEQFAGQVLLSLLKQGAPKTK